MNFVCLEVCPKMSENHQNYQVCIAKRMQFILGKSKEAKKV